MGNTLDDIIPKLLAQGLVVLRENAIMPRLVNQDYSLTPGQKGDTVNVKVSAPIASKPVVPAAVPPTSTNITPTIVPIAMNTWEEGEFHMTDSDYGKVEAGIIPDEAAEAVKGLANTVDGSLLALYAGVYGYVGTAAQTPFDTTNGLLAAKLARTLANKQLMPAQDRRFVLDPDAEGNASMLPNFQDYSKSGDQAVIREGMIGRKVGADWYMDQNVKTHTAGTITTGLIAKASTAQAVGLKTIVGHTAASTGACALVVGDIIAISGQSQTYVVTATATQAVANTDVNISIEPGLKVALVGSEDITVKASHVANMLIHRNAMALATRPLQDASGLAKSMSVVDPISGLTLRLEISREHKQTKFSYDILWGVKLIRPALAVRIAG